MENRLIYMLTLSQVWIRHLKTITHNRQGHQSSFSNDTDQQIYEQEKY